MTAWTTLLTWRCTYIRTTGSPARAGRSWLSSFTLSPARAKHTTALELESCNYLPSPVSGHASYIDLAESSVTGGWRLRLIGGFRRLVAEVIE